MGGRRVASTVAQIIILAVVMAAVLQSAAELYEVGDASGWTIPPQGNPTLYTDWASARTFVVNDVLEFAFTTGIHTVAEVSQSAYDNCDPNSKPIGLWGDGPAKVTLNSTGSFFFICTIGSHCSQGQKLSVQVSDSSGTPGTPPSPGTSTPNPPPPPSNSASSPPPPGNSASSPAAAAPTSLIFGLLVYLVGLLL